MGRRVEYDPEFRGPVADRSCRDIFFLLLFVIFCGGWAVLSWQAFSTGDPVALVYPTDSFNQSCGRDNSAAGQQDLTSRPYLYFTNPFSADAVQVCVDKCPAQTAVPATYADVICARNKQPADDAEMQQLVAAGECPLFVYKSTPVLYRCFPADYSNLTALIQANATIAAATGIGGNAALAIMSGQETARQVVGDFARTWRWFLAFAGIAAALCMLWLLVLRYFAGFFVWSVIMVALLALNGFAVFMYFTWRDKVDANLSAGVETDSTAREERTFFGVFIVAVVLAAVFDLILVALRSRLRVAIQIVKEASTVVRSMPAMLLFPITGFTAMLVLFAFWVVVELYLASASGSPSIADQQFDMDVLKYLQWYHLFGLFWAQQFISGINQCTLAGAVATWYWCRDKNALPPRPVLRSLWRTIRYNLGSVALGSLLIAVVRAIRFALFMVERQLRRAGGANNKLTKGVLACCQCCFACVERVFKFINKNAYIEMAIYGTPFCQSAKQAFQLLVRNAVRLVAVDAVAGFILFLSKVSVVCLTGCGAYYWLKYYYAENPLNYIAASVVVIMALAYVVAGVFMYVYDMTIDTIFLCFCEDCERNDGSDTRPYFMSERLQVLTSVKPAMKAVKKSKKSSTSSHRRNQVDPAGSGSSPAVDSSAFVQDL